MDFYLVSCTICSAYMSQCGKSHCKKFVFHRSLHVCGEKESLPACVVGSVHSFKIVTPDRMEYGPICLTCDHYCPLEKGNGEAHETPYCACCKTEPKRDTASHPSVHIGLGMASKKISFEPVTPPSCSSSDSPRSVDTDESDPDFAQFLRMNCVSDTNAVSPAGSRSSLEKFCPPSSPSMDCPSSPSSPVNVPSNSPVNSAAEPTQSFSADAPTGALAGVDNIDDERLLLDFHATPFDPLMNLSLDDIDRILQNNGLSYM